MSFINRKYKDSVLRIFLEAFYKKDSSSLELIVKVRNCTNPRMLPLAKDRDITFNKRFPKRSFKKAIDTAISQGILSDYLDRKSP